MFPHQQPGVFDYGFIGVYLQGEEYEGRSGWNDGSMDGNKCAYDDYDCHLDPNDATFVVGVISTMRALGASGRVYAYGSSNGANEVQILAANAVANPAALPIAGIAANSGQLLAQPTRSGPSPYDYNQPCAGTQPCAGGGAVAQLSIHGTGDGAIHYDGGKRLGSDVFILMAEEDSDAVWAAQNGCGATATSTNVSAVGHSVGATTAAHIVYEGCPPTAPVELYKGFGIQHVATQTLGGEAMMGVVLDFFTKVEAAHGKGGATPVPQPATPQPSATPAPPTPPATPAPPAPPTPATPPPSPDAPSAACVSCVQAACPAGQDPAACQECLKTNSNACASACVPYPFASLLAWFCSGA